MRVTSELRGDQYREHEWVDRYAVVWKWSEERQCWYGHSSTGGQDYYATDDEVSDYRAGGGRGPFLMLAD